MEIIGYIHTDFPDKFGVPRQSGLVKELQGLIEFEPKYRQPEAFNGIEEYEYLWILFHFHRAPYKEFQATVKPPRLGGNQRKGVFATRSPFRPNSIGLSSVKLEKVIHDEKKGTMLLVSGVDIIDGTPVLDIKPYLPYADSHQDARAGFSDNVLEYRLHVHIPEELLEIIPENKRDALKGILSEDPRPGYHRDDMREYGVYFDKYNVRFRVDKNTAVVFAIEMI